MCITFLCTHSHIYCTLYIHWNLCKWAGQRGRRRRDREVQSYREEKKDSSGRDRTTEKEKREFKTDRQVGYCCHLSPPNWRIPFILPPQPCPVCSLRRQSASERLGRNPTIHTYTRITTNKLYFIRIAIHQPAPPSSSPPPLSSGDSDPRLSESSLAPHSITPPPSCAGSASILILKSPTASCLLALYLVSPLAPHHIISSPTYHTNPIIRRCDLLQSSLEASLSFLIVLVALTCCRGN